MVKLKKLVILAILIQIYFAFEVSKLGVKYYNQTSEINVYANELTSQKTQLPFDYFYLNFCPTEKKIVQDENLGSLILGDVVIDNLPNLFENLEGNFEVGVPLGYYEKEDGKKKYYLYNHLTFTIKYHKKAVQQQNLKKNEKQQEQIQQYYVVEFFVDPESSYTNNIDGQIIPACELYNESPDNLKQEINVGEDDTYIAFTYDIVFEESDIDYTTRWDIYKKTLGEDEIHWFSLMNSMLIILFLTIILGQVLKRTLSRDIQRYSQVDQQEDLQQDLGWKQLQREVFRSPKRAIFMSTFTGVGIQIFCMTFITLTFTVIGIDQETVRGSFLNSLIICYVFMGTVSGYWSARIYKMLGGVYWLRSTLLVSLLYPSIVFGILFAVDFLLSLEGSMSMGFVVIIELITLWLGVSTPLVFIGAFFGFRREKIENPCSVNPVPNYIPPQPWYLQKKVIYIVGDLC
ncbi:hypothetical protein PPERSA_01711 [Pseudocohnilembus persalinus]|uniref:Transmembrane 9 superfamily member n=1 Tax=Pseudocohnilembus persalinus TaxID=266149 RepID=A0A0V0R0U4_PSEPJ|nr:hypothetical protein PPERSA_01711 [Pseudocohnilembus persalinus]|eukprot:KRX08166.1 hypothetical protein PPERSA_01711 [Pseudocohnilembus persalinus]